MKRIILCSLVSIFLTGCNNSARQAEQQARDKFVADSVTQAIQTAAAAKQNLENQKSDMQKAVAKLTQEEFQLQQAFAQNKASLTAAQDNLRSVSEFHLLRSSSERQNEIRAASLRVNEIQLNLDNIQQRYTEVQNNLAAAKEKLTAMQ